MGPPGGSCVTSEYSKLDRLIVDDSSSDQRLTLAGEHLENCSGVVVLEGVATLWPRPDVIDCTVTEPAPAMARCEEEYKVLVENAARALQTSKLGRRLPDRPLRWAVIDDHGTGTIEVWHAP
jgi:hypothetical protein